MKKTIVLSLIAVMLTMALLSAKLLNDILEKVD